MEYKKGDKIKFVNEKKAFTVKACNDRFLVCTQKRFRKTYYTIVDFFRNVRGTENLIFCMGFETDEKCKEALLRLSNNESEVSYRNFVELDIIEKNTLPKG